MTDRNRENARWAQTTLHLARIVRRHADLGIPHVVMKDVLSGAASRARRDRFHQLAYVLDEATAADLNRRTDAVASSLEGVAAAIRVIDPIDVDPPTPVLTYSGAPVRYWDDGDGRLWLYRDASGLIGVVRTRSFEDAWDAVVDEILDGGTVEETSERFGVAARDLDQVEGVHWRSSGEPASPWCHGPLAWSDPNGDQLEPLTPDLAREVRIVVAIPCVDDGCGGFVLPPWDDPDRWCPHCRAAYDAAEAGA